MVLKVMQNIGTMKYKLELPTSSRAPLVLHVWFLNKVIGDKFLAQIILLELDEEGKVIVEPKKVMEIRTQQLWNRSIFEYLIKWKNLTTEYFAWEEENFIHKHQELLKHRWQHFLKERGMLGPYTTSVAPSSYY